MTLLKRRVAGAQGEPAEHNGGGGSLSVAAFEYVEVEETAVVRLTGTWSGRTRPADMALVVSREDGERESFPALADVSRRPHFDRGPWQVTFSAPVGIVER